MFRATFVYAAACIALGIGATMASANHDTGVIARSAFFFGGATLICAFFGVKNRIHGLAGAAFLSFLATLTSVGAVLTQAQGGQFDLASFPTRFLLAFAGASILYLLGAVLTYRKSRRERMLAELQEK